MDFEDWTGIPYVFHINFRMVGTAKYEDIEVNATETSFNITGLESYTEYEIMVAPATVIGEGPNSAQITQRSGIGGKNIIFVIMKIKMFLNGFDMSQFFKNYRFHEYIEIF